MPRKPPPVPPTKPCARCLGQRPPGRRRDIHAVGSVTRSVATCDACAAYCSEATPGTDILGLRQCLRDLDHPIEQMCMNAKRDTWRRGSDAYHTNQAPLGVAW